MIKNHRILRKKIALLCLYLMALITSITAGLPSVFASSTPVFESEKRIGVTNDAMAAASASKDSKDYFEDSKVTEGIKYTNIKISKQDYKQSLHLLEIDFKADSFELESVFGKDCLYGKETVSSMAKRKNALAAINGSFFSSNGNPLGMIVHQGRIIKEPILGRTVMGITKQGQVFFDNPKFDARFFYKKLKSNKAVALNSNGTDNANKQQANSSDTNEAYETHFVELDGINRKPDEDEIIVYTPEYGNSTMTKYKNSVEIVVAGEKVVSIARCNSIIPPDGYVIYAGGVMSSELHAVTLNDEVYMELYANPIWEQAEFAVSGGPRLIKDSEIVNAASAEKFREDVARGRAPRTAVGITKDNKMIFVCVDGRRKNAAGMTLRELSKFMLSRGVVDAMNLDGGGSTTFYLMGKVMNSPSDGHERPVSQALILKPRSAPESLAKKIGMSPQIENKH